jgi:hypothetical protein
MSQGRFFPKWRETWRSSEYRLPRREEVIVIAILDAFAILATVVAAAVLSLHAASADTSWWWGVAVSSLLVVSTSVLLSQLWVRRRSFIDESLRLADHLDELRKPQGPRVASEEFEEFVRRALQLRELVRASGDWAVADRLTFALAGSGAT